MIRRTALLSALSFSLLLSACGKDKDDTAADAQAETAAQAEDGSEQADETPAPRMKYWPILGPMVAGTYGGACLRKADMGKVDGAITVGADGKASSKDIDVDFREASKISLIRTGDAKDGYGMTATISMPSEADGFLNLSSLGGGTVGLVRGDQGVVCSNTGGMDRLNSQPLYQALASLVSGKKQALSCVDTRNIMTRRDVDVEIDGSILKIGDASLDMKLAATEMVNVEDGGSSVLLSVTMPDQSMATLIYDGTGTLTNATSRNKTESTHACERKQDNGG